jgi:predicted murein hydrolase (TIGR00659 family)
MIDIMLHSPLFFIALTLFIFESADLVYRYSHQKLYLNPLLVTTVSIIVILKSMHISYPSYFSGVQFIHLLLGPATVALAVPIYEQREKIKQSLVPLLGTLLVSSFTGVISSVLVVFAWGGSLKLAYTVAPKSVTTPIAMGISEKLGGIPEITAALVILTGLFGAAVLPIIYRFLPPKLKIHSLAAQGLGFGAASHGVGMARAFQDGNVSGTYAGLAIGINGIITAFLAPTMMPLLRYFFDK